MPRPEPPDPLRQATALVPHAVTGATGTTVADAVEYLDHHEYGTALDILLELGEAHPAGESFWELLAAGAAEMNLGRTESWCHWRQAETRHGVIRVDLRLLDPALPSARRTAVPGDGRLRPLWHIGLRTRQGDPDLHVARIWVERAARLEPGACGPVRLAPLSPARWRHLRPGDQITMHEQAPPAGTATVTQASFPP